MGVTIKGKSGTSYEFYGAYSSTMPLKDNLGVYAILCEKDKKLNLIDVGESAKVKERVENHDRRDCWEINCLESIKYAAYYIEHGRKPSRTEVEQDIRDNYNIPCGEK